MKLQLNGSIIKIIETLFVILLLVWGDGLDLPSSIIRVINPLTYLLVAILIFLRFQRVAYFATRDISLLLLVGLAGVSIFWSENISVTSNLFRSALRTTLLGVYIAACYPPKKQMLLLFWVGSIVLPLSLAVGLAIPTAQFTGIFGHKNYLARTTVVLAITYLLLTFDLSRYRWAAIIGFFLSVAILLLSQGKTGLSVFLISLSLVPFFPIIVKQRYKLRIVFLMITILLFICVAILVVVNLETIVVDWMGKNLQFSNRVPIWERVIPKIWERPLLGYGFQGFWSSEEGLTAIRGVWMESFVLQGKGHAHNGFLDLMLGLGLIGMLLFAINLIGIFKRILSLIFITQKIEYFWMLELILVTQAYQMGEVMTTLSNNYLWALYVSICLSSVAEFNHHKELRFKRHNLLTDVYKKSIY